jgi:hypothetical protein
MYGKGYVTASYMVAENMILFSLFTYDIEVSKQAYMSLQYLLELNPCEIDCNRFLPGS